MKKLITTTIFSLLMAGTVAPAIADNQPVPGGTELRVHKLKYFSEYDTMINMVKQQEYEKAFPELLRYARYGDKHAQFLTGVFLISGHGVEENAEQGLVWLQLALEQQTTEWKLQYRNITNGLTEQQLMSLEPLVAEYKAKYGVDAQFMRCKNEREKGTNIVKHICKKDIFHDDYYKIVEYPIEN